MKPSPKNILLGLGLIVIGVALAVAGVFIGHTDDAPGAALLGVVLMIGMTALGVRMARRRV